MKKLFTVYDSFPLSIKGTAIAGTNDEFDLLSKNEIQRLIGENVILRRVGMEDLRLQVKEVEISVSLINKKNIFIHVTDEIQSRDIPIGSEIYKCS
jgi:hypothetical protein